MTPLEPLERSEPPEQSGPPKAPHLPEPADGIGPTPLGFHHFERRIRLGSGDGADPAFERGRALLRVWGPQVGAGIRVEGGEVSPAVGNTAVLHARIGGVLRMHAPLRVCWTVDVPGRAGFAYETLPGHPEHGRESFVVTRVRDDASGVDDVWFTVEAYSRPAAWYARLGGPVSRMIQLRYANKYLLAMAVVRRGRGRRPD